MPHQYYPLVALGIYFRPCTVFRRSTQTVECCPAQFRMVIITSNTAHNILSSRLTECNRAGESGWPRVSSTDKLERDGAHIAHQTKGNVKSTSKTVFSCVMINQTQNCFNSVATPHGHNALRPSIKILRLACLQLVLLGCVGKVGLSNIFRMGLCHKNTRGRGGE